MKQGISLHIGLNSVNPNHYDGWSGELNACEYDANDMEAIAHSMGFQTQKLLTASATRAQVFIAIEKAAQTLKSGDLFLITNSSHGGQIPDFNDEKEEPDGMDETWCFYDGQVLDDELYLQYSKFKAGVRILIISDSCNSGTVAKIIEAPAIKEPKKRYMPAKIADAVYKKNEAFYRSLQQATKEQKLKKGSLKDAMQASGILIGAAQDGHSSYDGNRNGAFTEQLKKVWNNGNFNANYISFKQQIADRLKNQQVDDPQNPNYFLFGKKDSNFENQKPFTI